MPSIAPIIPFLLLFLWLLQGCASDRAPSGGSADTTPLRLLASTPINGTQNFKGNQLQLYFSHEVSSRALLRALRTFPDIGQFELTVNGKRADIQLLDTLQANQTYTLLLNRHLSDFRGQLLHAPTAFAFSTGNSVDNGTIRGTVVHYNGTPASNALLLAFASAEKGGTVNLLENKPTQIAQCDASGSFAFNHLPHGSYHVVAINDRNNDLAWAPSNEEYATPSQPLIATNSANQLLRLSPPLKSPKPLNITLEASSAPTNSTIATGSLSGMCTVRGNPPNVIIEAISSSAFYYTLAVRKKAGSYTYLFSQLPVGEYTLAASIPNQNYQPNQAWQWNAGSVEPFVPSDSFTFYPETVTIREEWLTERINITFPTILQ